MDFPVSTQEIEKFEKKNEDIVENVLYIYEEGQKGEIDPRFRRSAD